MSTTTPPPAQPRIAAVQMNSGAELSANLAQAEALLRCVTSGKALFGGVAVFGVRMAFVPLLVVETLHQEVGMAGVALTVFAVSGFSHTGVAVPFEISAKPSGAPSVLTFAAVTALLRIFGVVTALLRSCAVPTLFLASCVTAATLVPRSPPASRRALSGSLPRSRA